VWHNGDLKVNPRAARLCAFELFEHNMPAPSEITPVSLTINGDSLFPVRHCEKNSGRCNETRHAVLSQRASAPPSDRKFWPRQIESVVAAKPLHPNRRTGRRKLSPRARARDSIRGLRLRPPAVRAPSAVGAIASIPALSECEKTFSITSNALVLTPQKLGWPENWLR